MTSINSRSSDGSLPTGPPEDRAQPPSRWRHRLSILTKGLIWLYLAAVLALWLIMRGVGERWWPATLMLFSPRWIWATPLALLLPMVLLWRRRAMPPALLAAALVLFGIMDFRVPWHQAFAGGPTHESVRIVTCNLHGQQARPEVLNAFVAQQHPDVIVLQDYVPSRRPAAIADGNWFTLRDNELYVASRYPLARVEDFPLQPHDEKYAREGWSVGHATCYALWLPGGTIHLVGLHLASPHQPLGRLRADLQAGPGPLTDNSEQRRQESALISSRIGQIGGPFLIAGDFNTPDDSPTFRASWNNFNDAFGVAGFGFGTTYAKHHTWLRIDHILADPTWHCRACEVGSDVGSGHRPVAAEFTR